MSNYAWVTLATNDSYSLGALVVAHSLKNVNTAHQTAVLITPGVSQSMKSKLEATFNVVVEVNVLDSKDAANLALLSRPELGITFTKLHCWRLTQFQKCVFLDADTLVLQNCDELFDREELSAAPDVGWPDCFNSGVFVFQPNLETFGKLIEFATRQGSFDGGDQGLLNSFFSDWASKDISKHLPFIYNTCSTACYSYLPAFKQFGKNVKILHFIGQVKPWLLNFDSSSKTAYAPSGYGHLGDFIQQWWNLFCDNVHPSLSTEMTTSAHPQNSDETQWYQNQHSQAPFLIPISSHSDPPQVKFIDPWDTYYETNIIHTDSQPHDCNIDANVVQIDDTVPCSNYHQNHESSHASHNIVGHCDDHQQNHKENANVDIQRTITAEPHISIRSSSVNEFNEIDSNPNLHQDSYNHVEDTSNHSININSFQTFNHDYSQANTSESPSIGCDVPKIDERDRDSYQSSNYDGDVEDETTLTVEEGGLAGALAQLTLGAPRSAEQQAYEDSMRRQCWESGNIDYLGKDSFDNIWKRITKTIETKSDTPPTEKYRSPTPQPEEKLAVGEKTEVNVGAPFKESEEDGLKTTPVKEEIVTEVTSDGRIIEKKIVTYPGEETTEIEEIEEVDGQTVSVKRSVVASESKDHQPKPAAELKNEPVVLVPGYRTVEIDEKTNSTIVTEKTTKGYQQTITTVLEDGTKKIQTKTFFDPVEIPGEVEEEETYEETETIEHGTKQSTEEAITGSGTTDVVECSAAKADSNIEKTEIKSEVQDQSVEAFSKQEEVIVAEKEATPIEATNEAQPTTTTANENETPIAPKSETLTEPAVTEQETKESKALTDLKSQPVVIVPGHQKVEFNAETNTTTVTEKTTTGYQQTTTTVTADGRTLTQTKTFYDPIPVESTVEEVEEEETTTTTITEVAESAVSVENESEVQKTEPIQEIQKSQEETQPIKEEKDINVTTTDAHDSQLVPTGATSLTQRKTTSDGKEIEVETTVSEDGKTKTLRKTVRQPSEEIEIEEYEETHSYEPGEVKVITTTKTIPLVEEASKEIRKDIVDTSLEVVETKTTSLVEEATKEISKDVVETPSEAVETKTTPLVQEAPEEISKDVVETPLEAVETKPTPLVEEAAKEISKDVADAPLEAVETKPTPLVEEAPKETSKDVVDAPLEAVETKPTPLVEEAPKEISKDVVDTPVEAVETKATPLVKESPKEISKDIVDTPVEAVETKATPLVEEALKEVSKDVIDTSSKVLETPKTVDVAKQVVDAKIAENKKQAPIKFVTPKKDADKSVDTNVKQSTSTTELKETTTAKKETTAEAKQTTTTTKKTKAKQATPTENQTTTEVKQITTEAKQTIAAAKETTLDAKQTTTAKETTTEAKQTSKAAKQTTTEAKQTTTTSKQTAAEGSGTAKQPLTSVKKPTAETKSATVAAKQTTIETKQATTEVKQTSPQAKKSQIESKEPKKEANSDQADTSVKKLTSTKTNEKTAKTTATTTKTTPAKKDEIQAKPKTEVVKKDALKSDKKTTKPSTDESLVGKPKVTTANGETVTEVVRRIPGGTEHTLTTVKADGTTKTETKKVFDAVEVSGSEEEYEEYEEYEEVVEEDAAPVKTVTTKVAGTANSKGPKTPTVTAATPPNTPPLKALVIDGASNLKAEHEIPDTPPLDKVEQLRKKKTSVCTYL